jgi:AcrR family transcriptional regulator
LPRPKLKTPRKPLTREWIEKAALDLIERDGLQSFSTRKLAEVLGCEAMSIYHHFPSKAHLMDALLDRVLAETEMPPREMPWLERMRAMAHALRATALARPQFFQFLALHRMKTPGGLRMLEEVIGAFRDAGLTDEKMARLFRAYSYYVIGAVLDEAAGYAKGPSAAVPVPGDVFRRDFPTVASVGPFFRPEHHKATFETGLEILLDGIAKEAKRARMR